MDKHFFNTENNINISIHILTPPRKKYRWLWLMRVTYVFLMRYQIGHNKTQRNPE